jgi:hypothetical protein
MHALQNYGEEEPTYDGNAYTYSSTYHAGTLKLYEHHVTAPTAPDGRPEYHMSQVKAYALTSDLETCVAGIGAFRNARDLAQRHRDEFIQGANARARRSDALLVDEPRAAEAQQYGDPGSDEFVDCEEYLASGAVATETITASSRHVDEGTVLSQYFYAEDKEHSQESTSLDAMEPAMSFTTSPTSSFSTPSVTRSKRNRGSRSPPTQPRVPKKQNLAKRRTRDGTP